MSSLNKTEARKRRHFRVRKKISGSSERPRLAVFRSNKHIYAQIIDDVQAKTLASASTSNSGIKDKKVTSNVEAAKEVGKSIAKKAKDKGVKEVVFDRGGYLYHGRVKALAEAARDNGLIF